MLPDSSVEILFEDYVGLAADIGSTSPSGLNALNRSYNKVVLIAAASNLETLVKRVVQDVFQTQGREELGTFVYKKVMSRHYSQLFEWPRRKATGFFSSFGEHSSRKFKTMFDSDPDFRAEHDAFMELGDLRNELVHQDYATYPLQKTPGEIIELYRLAVRFPYRFNGIILRSPNE